MWVIVLLARGYNNIFLNYLLLRLHIKRFVSLTQLIFTVAHSIICTPLPFVQRLYRHKLVV